MKQTVVALTTNDNPYDPIDQFNEWYMYDMECGYNTCGYLMKIAHPTEVLSDFEELREMEAAIDEILEFDFDNRYKKVKREVEISEDSE